MSISCFEKEGIKGRFGHDEAANDLGVEIMEIIKEFNLNHKNKYCEGTGGHFLLHAQVGLAEDENVTPGTTYPDRRGTGRADRSAQRAEESSTNTSPPEPAISSRSI